MRKILLTFVIAMLAAIAMVFTVSAETITVVDDGTNNITLGECVIDGLDREIPSPSESFTFVLDTETQTAKITKWANYSDESLGVALVIPSTVTYNGTTYTVNKFDRVVFMTNDGKNQMNKGNYILEKVYIPDTVVAIPNNAFDSCRDLQYVYVGKNVETIGTKAFQYASFTGEAYYMDDGTGKLVNSETLGISLGNMKEFIWTTNKITTLTVSCFHHIEFTKDAIIQFPIENITVFESNCLSYNSSAFQSGHYFTGKQMTFGDTLDIRNATSIASDAFSNNMLATTYILNANQVNSLNIDTLRGNGANYPSGHKGTFIIYGGETAETAVKLSKSIWTSNLFYWGAVVHYSVIFKGYVNAPDVADGIQGQNGYGKDMIDYFFDSEASLNHYIQSVASTAKANETYTRYAKNNTKGYFNVCNGNGTYKAYNLSYVDGVASLVQNTTNVPALMTESKIVNGKCTPSICCKVCEYEVEKGLDHDLKFVIAYEKGYAAQGTKTYTCQRDNCEHEVAEAVSAIFGTAKYSIKDDNSAICVSYTINQSALKMYEENTGVDVNYGIIAAAYVDEVDVQPYEKANKIECNLSNNLYSAIDLKITADWTVNNNDLINLALNLYYTTKVDGEEQVNYVGLSGTSTACETVTYKQFL